MKCLKLFLTILVLFISAVYTKRLTEAQKKVHEEHKKCRLAEKADIHPLDCCKYPRFFDNTPQNLKDCDVNCRMLPYPLFSCVRNCIIERYGVFVRGGNGYVGPNRITDAFCDQDEIPGIRPLDLQWRHMVYNSSIFCFTEFPLSPTNDGKRNVSTEESWNYYYMNYVECIRKKNFLECKLNDIPECKKLRDSIVHCHQPDYAFLHKIFFEDFYYRNKTEEKRLKKLKEENKPDLYEESHKNDVTDESATSQSPMETKSYVDVESTRSDGDTTSDNDKSTQIQNESSTSKNVKDNGSSGQDPGVTGAMK